MLQFDIEKAKKFFDCDEDQYNEEYLLNTLKDYLDYLMSYNRNFTTKQYLLIRDCWSLINCINLVDKEEED